MRLPDVRCELCGQPAEPHHIVGRGAGGVDEPYNVLRLCRTHHRQYHDKGWVWFCDEYPRVSGKVLVARETQGKHITQRVVVL